jgi:hypothetical protein
MNSTRLTPADRSLCRWAFAYRKRFFPRERVKTTLSLISLYILDQRSTLREVESAIENDLDDDLSIDLELLKFSNKGEFDLNRREGFAWILTWPIPDLEVSL